MPTSLVLILTSETFRGRWHGPPGPMQSRLRGTRCRVPRWRPHPPTLGQCPPHPTLPISRLPAPSHVPAPAGSQQPPLGLLTAGPCAPSDVSFRSRVPLNQISARGACRALWLAQNFRSWACHARGHITRVPDTAGQPVARAAWLPSQQPRPQAASQSASTRR